MKKNRCMQIPVVDPFGVAADPEMPSLQVALDPVRVEQYFNRHLSRLGGSQSVIHLQAIRVTRYKPRRRCLIEYDVEVKGQQSLFGIDTLIGKIRAGHSIGKHYRCLKAFWNAGFRTHSADGYSVPKPIGMVPECHMWLQQKVPGQVATDLLDTPDAATLVRRIAEAAHKLHLAGVRPRRRHTMADELRILRDRLPSVARIEPGWTGRIDRILAASERLGAKTPEPVICGIHRDFYPDQVIVDGRRLYLIDFDLYCQGDPGLDIGNFLGHLTEQSLRTHGDATAFLELERAMEERFVELAGEATRPAVQAYATLTLVRHIYLSTLFPERRPFTASLLDLCEKRLDLTRLPQMPVSPRDAACVEQRAGMAAPGDRS